MTEDETDAGTGRLARRYADTRRKIACVRGRVNEVCDAAGKASRDLQCIHTGDYAETKAQFDAVPWSDISDWLEKLAKLGEEKEQLETCLRDAGLGDLIR